jgi:putative PEP-CTERM system histidine kinase
VFYANIVLANLIALAIILVYLSMRLNKHSSICLFIVSIIPLIILELGCYFFLRSPTSITSATLIVLALGLIPLPFAALSYTLGRDSVKPDSIPLCAYYVAQIVVFFFFARDLYAGRIIDWLTGILDEPLILITNERRYWVINLLVSCGVVLFGFENTLRNASRKQADGMKFVLTAFAGLIVYFAYLSVQLLLFSYISESMLLVGVMMISVSLILLLYAFVKHPFWEVEIRVSRRIIFGSLSATVLAVYLVISGSIIDLVRFTQPDHHIILVPAMGFASVAAVLIAYLSPKFRARLENFLTRNFFINKYDYRALWTKFSEKSSGSLNITELLPRIGEFIADSMFVEQVAIWLRSQDSEAFVLAYLHEPVGSAPVSSFSLRLRKDWDCTGPSEAMTTSDAGNISESGNAGPSTFVEGQQIFEKLRINNFVMVKNGKDLLGIVGVGADIANRPANKEDNQLLASMSNQLANLIMNHRLSEQLLLAREWEFFNRFSSFILHDLKNLATLQSMTLENAQGLKNNPQFLTDAFTTFQQTTDKMINLIASLSVQKGQLTLQQQPLNILAVIENTFTDLKIEQRTGVNLVTKFPPAEPPPMIFGDPELLQKAFTNILLNAIQSLPHGKGLVEIKVIHPNNGKITTAITDTGCGIAPERLQRLFRPFQTSKQYGMGIGLCHTRSIIEVHGGHIYIESQMNAGTKVQVDLPTLAKQKGTAFSETQDFNS